MNFTALSKTLSMQPRLKILAQNSCGKDYFVGDINGHYRQLQQALKKVHFHPQNDRLICTGNLIDYGLQSEQVLALLNQPWCFSVMGIHELLMRTALESGHYLHWHTHGGEWGFLEDMQLRPELAALSKLVNKLPLAIEVSHKKVGTIGVVSAGPGNLEDWQQIKNLRTTQALDLLLDETLATRKQPPVTGVDFLVVGNQAAKEPWCRGNVVGINLGARLMPERGQLTLVKPKKLAKVREQKIRFKPLV